MLNTHEERRVLGREKVRQVETKRPIEVEYVVLLGLNSAVASKEQDNKLLFSKTISIKSVKSNINSKCCTLPFHSPLSFTASAIPR